MRIVTKEEVLSIDETYAPLLTSDHPIVMDDHSVLRWQETPLVRWLVDQMHACHERRDGFTLNHMAIAHQHGVFSTEAFMQFYREMGYSLCGFIDVWHEEIYGQEKG